MWWSGIFNRKIAGRSKLHVNLSHRTTMTEFACHTFWSLPEWSNGKDLGRGVRGQRVHRSRCNRHTVRQLSQGDDPGLSGKTTRTWVKGDDVTKGAPIAVGTAIATFVEWQVSPERHGACRGLPGPERCRHSGVGPVGNSGKGLATHNSLDTFESPATSSMTQKPSRSSSDACGLRS